MTCARFLSAQDSDEVRSILPSAQVKLRNPQAIAYSPTGLIYIADSGNQRVIAVDSIGVLVYETGGFGKGNGQFNRPRDVTAEFGTEVWVLDYGNRRLQKFTRSLEWIATLDFERIEGADEIRPSEMAESPSGDLFLFDVDHGQIIRLNSAGQIVAASGGKSDFLRGGTNFVCGGNGHLYWIDSQSGSLLEIDAALTTDARPAENAQGQAPLLTLFETESAIDSTANRGNGVHVADGDSLKLRSIAEQLRLHADDRAVMMDRGNMLVLRSREGRLERVRLPQP